MKKNKDISQDSTPEYEKALTKSSFQIKLSYYKKMKGKHERLETAPVESADRLPTHKNIVPDF